MDLVASLHSTVYLGWEGVWILHPLHIGVSAGLEGRHVQLHALL